MENIETGKDGSQERCCVCGNEHRRKDLLMKCDYCTRVVHQKQCAGIGKITTFPWGDAGTSTDDVTLEDLEGALESAAGQCQDP